MCSRPPVAGVNLYNNGFSGGLVATVLYPILTSLLRHRRPVLRNNSYYELFEHDEPIDTSRWRTHKVGEPRPAPAPDPQPVKTYRHPKMPVDTPDPTEELS